MQQHGIKTESMQTWGDITIAAKTRLYANGASTQLCCALVLYEMKCQSELPKILLFLWEWVHLVFCHGCAWESTVGFKGYD